MTEEIDSDALRMRLDFALDRVEDALHFIEKDIQETQLQSVHYGLFEDALEVAGYLSYFKEPEEKVQKYLRIATHSAAVLFQYQGKTKATIIELPEFTRRSFIDYSVTNPWVYIRAIYAAAVTNELKILKGLLNIPINDVLKGQEQVPDDLMNYIKYLPAIVHKQVDLTVYPTITFWSMQANALKAVLKVSDPKKALEKLEEELSEYYSEEKYQDKPERLYLLPVHGLNAIQKIKDKL